MGDNMRKNVIVVGAGASAEFDLPTGVQLAGRLRMALNFNQDNFGSIVGSAGDRNLASAISKFCQDSGRDRNVLFQAARQISANMPLAPSIDNYLDTHSHNSDLVVVGKMAIANEIMNAERRSLLMVQEGNIFNQINFERLRETWISVFFRIIVAKRKFENFLDALANITFISFNYDRCIKHFLVSAAASYFDLREKDIVKVLGAINVIHPYGSVGSIEVSGGRATGFGSSFDASEIISSSDKIRTFTEGVIDTQLSHSIKSSFEGADLVMFLGFAFLDINMQVLTPKDGGAKRVLATAMGRSADTKLRLQSLISTSFMDKRFRAPVEMFDGRCSDLFYEFDHYLAEIQPK
jgi:hypothetical protein